jgi:orotate phosphoribosyltransferase
LLDLLVRYSYKYDPSGPFQLASGKRSRFYVDCKATTMRGEAKELVGGLVAAQIPADVAAVGGLTMGADPIAGAVASYCTRHGRPMNAFSVRKEPKKHGLGKWIEGGVQRGTRVAVVDDVVTTGSATIDAIRRCREEGLEVGAVVVLVDREEEGGLAAIRKEGGPGLPVTRIFTLAELQERADTRASSAGSRSATR